MCLSMIASNGHLRHIYACGSVDGEYGYADCNSSRQNLGAQRIRAKEVSQRAKSFHAYLAENKENVYQ